MEKSRLKSTFLPYHVKKNHSALEVDTFKVLLLLSYLASLDNKPHSCKSIFLDIEITINNSSEIDTSTKDESFFRLVYFSSSINP